MANYVCMYVEKLNYLARERNKQELRGSVKCFFLRFALEYLMNTGTLCTQKYFHIFVK